jgi:hypothetical protein
MRRLRTAILAVAIALPGSALAQTTAADEPDCTLPTIGDVRLEQESVFGDIEDANWLYRLGDRLHIDTRPRIIRRELLFAPGQVVDLEALAQTERNLRSTRFIAEARVALVAKDGRRFDSARLAAPGARPCTALEGVGQVDVVVWTRDSWSTAISAGISKQDKRYLWSVELEESNLIGLGKTVRLEHRTDIERDTNSVAYFDPRVAGTRNQAELVLSDQSDGHRVFLQAGRPFFAIDTELGWNARLEQFEQIDRLWENGEQVRGLRHVRRHLRFGAAWLVRQAGNTALRIHAGLAHRYDDVQVEVRGHDAVELAFTITEHAFLKLAYLNHERPEDVNLGTDMRAQIGLAAARSNTDSDNAVFFDFGVRRGIRLGPRRFGIATVIWNGRMEGGLRNAILDARFGLADGSLRRQLFILRGWFRQGRNFDPEVQLTLGANNGLRGYPVNQFVGDRSLLLGAEYRRFLIDDVLRFASVGVAAFVDSGYAWAPDDPVRLADLRTDVGIGLLLGRRSVSTGRAGLRFDLAYAFDPLPGRSQWVLSFGTETTLGF